MQSWAQASRPPSRPGGRFRHRAHFAVTRGALSRLAPSCLRTTRGETHVRFNFVRHTDTAFGSSILVEGQAFKVVVRRHCMSQTVVVRHALHALLIWKRCQVRTRKPVVYAPQLHIVGLPQGDPISYFMATGLSEWPTGGILIVGDCFEKGRLVPLGDLFDLYNLPKWSVFDLRGRGSNFRELVEWGRRELITYNVLQLLLSLGAARQLITWFYRTLTEMVRAPLTSLKITWEESWDIRFRMEIGD
ncbi:hypothetical protein NDU88_001189 [Pleurodeles waltl]|uniref:Uncharacterized protein n=1 Tax=Pleurodeles waltl TaxID=8319 RepID=A0AAV7THW2_PLEWA|nr:hypothetical protein NDU88_001189 [Pleurodeles waltl]